MNSVISPVRKPYLIQRGTINKPFVALSERFSKAVDLDYMGSAEFEFGSIPKSLRALYDKVDNINITVMDSITEITEKGTMLRVLHTFNEQEWNGYKHWLLALRNTSLSKIYTKERTDFDPSTRSRFGRTDFWWDIQNHVMWSFDKKFMERLPDHLVASWKYMNEQRETHRDKIV